MKTLVIGLGNPILGDDGVGWVVAQQVETSIGETSPEFRVECFALAGISLMEQMIGYERVILVDSLNTGQHPQGHVISFCLQDLPDLTYGHSASAHDLSLKNALILGRSMGADLPADGDVYIVAIEAAHVFDFSETLTPSIQAAVPAAVAQTLTLLELQPVR